MIYFLNIIYNFLIGSYTIFNSNSDNCFINQDSGKPQTVARCGGPASEFFPSSSLSTKIVGKCSPLMQRIHNQQCMSYTERARWHTFESMQQMAGDKGNLAPVTIDTAKRYYIEMSKRKLSRGAIRQGLIACCIMYACKDSGFCRSVKEISEMSGVDCSIINKSSKIFEKIMADVLRKDNKNIKSTSVEDLISRYINMMNLEKSLQIALSKKVRSIANAASKSTLLQGKTPTAATTSYIFVALEILGHTCDKKQLAGLFKISLVTINKTTAIVKEILNEK